LQHLLPKRAHGISPLTIGMAQTRVATSTRPVIGHAHTVPGIIVANIASNARIEKGTRNQAFIGLCNDTLSSVRVPWRPKEVHNERDATCVVSLYPHGVRQIPVMNEAKAKKIKARVNRISGQVGGIGHMIDEDRYCLDVLDQIAAVRSALDALGVELLTNHIECCVVGHGTGSEHEDAKPRSQEELLAEVRVTLGRFLK
jgi:DNA-binding FrmR family transcriptional regulator